MNLRSTLLNQSTMMSDPNYNDYLNDTPYESIEDKEEKEIDSPVHLTKTDSPIIKTPSLTDIIDSHDKKQLALYLHNHPDTWKMRNILGDNIVHIAAKSGHVTALKQIYNHLKKNDQLQQLWEVNNVGYQPLYYACSFNTSCFVEHLLMMLGPQRAVSAVKAVGDYGATTWSACKNNPRQSEQIKQLLTPYLLAHSLPPLSELISRTTLFSFYPEVKKNKNLKILLSAAIFATNVTRTIIKNSSTHPQSNTYDREGKTSRFRRLLSHIDTMRIESRKRLNKICRAHKSQLKKGIISDTYAQQILNEYYQTGLTYRAGNCFEFGYVFMKVLSEIDPTFQSELFEIEPGDHVINIINRDPKTNPTNLITWNKDAFAVDSWALNRHSEAAIYRACDIPKFLHYYYFEQSLKQAIIGPVNLHYHKFRPNLEPLPALKPRSVFRSNTIRIDFLTLAYENNAPQLIRDLLHFGKLRPMSLREIIHTFIKKNKTKSRFEKLFHFLQENGFHELITKILLTAINNKKSKISHTTYFELACQFRSAAAITQLLSMHTSDELFLLSVQSDHIFNTQLANWLLKNNLVSSASIKHAFLATNTATPSFEQLWEHYRTTLSYDEQLALLSEKYAANPQDQDVIRLFTQLKDLQQVVDTEYKSFDTHHLTLFGRGIIGKRTELRTLLNELPVIPFIVSNDQGPLLLKNTLFRLYNKINDLHFPQTKEEKRISIRHNHV